MTVEVPMIAQQALPQQSLPRIDAVQQWQMQQFFQQTINSLQLRASFGLEELNNIVGRVGGVGRELQHADQIFDDAREEVHGQLDDFQARLARRESALDAAAETGHAGGSGDAPVTMQDLQAFRQQMLRDSFQQMRESMEMSRRFMELSTITSRASNFVQFSTQISSALRDSIRRLTDGT